MSTDTVEEHRAASRVDQPTTSAAALTAMGIVYGDLSLARSRMASAALAAVFLAWP